ncbi:MAG: MBL fold metallo-hydrolase [Proteobacteria bacterium]|nr:MBL fold metallo-hydrolase [Pseudomonadota bacterium]
MKTNRKIRLSLFILFLALVSFLSLATCVTGPSVYTEKSEQVSDHFNSIRYFNPDVPQTLSSQSGQAAKRNPTWWVWNWILRTDWPDWPKRTDFLPEPPPVARVPEGSIYITPVGHATFLIQLDGVNILTDPMWSERCSPVSLVGPKRYSQPGISFEDLPPVDVVLVSHNHYDHFDLPTLEGLAKKGGPRAIVPLGNLDLMRSTGIATVDELDWWQSVPLSSKVTVTLVPAQHFSARTLWDRDRTLWGGFVISGPSGNVYYSGDTGYGPHFREIARRFSPIRVAILPIAPFRPPQTRESTPGYRPIVHMGPAEAVKAHMDLETPLSIAAHFQVFRLGIEGFNDAVDVLAASLKEHNLKPDAFVTPVFGQVIKVPPMLDSSLSTAGKAYPIGLIQGFTGAGPSVCPQALVQY